MVKTLLVDTNRATYTIYQALVEKGHEVWVVGGNPDEPMAKISPHYISLDYSDTEALTEAVDSQGFNFIVPGCTDVSYKVCADLNGGRFPGLDTPENARLINDKSQFRRVASELSIPVPQVVDAKGALRLESVIVKPVDSFSGHGISTLRSPSVAELHRAHQEACAESRTGTALIEEFVSGQLYSHSAFISNGEIVADFIVREDCTTSPFAVDTSCVEFDFDPDTLNSLRADANRLYTGLNLVDGLIHTQFILDGTRYWWIETTRRCPGDLYALLIEMSTGYPYGASYAASFIGEAPLPVGAGTRRERIIRHTATSEDGESIWGLAFKTPVDLKFLVPLAKAGDFITPSPYGRAALLFLKASSDAEHNSLYQRLLKGDLYSYGLATQ